MHEKSRVRNRVTAAPRIGTQKSLRLVFLFLLIVGALSILSLSWKVFTLYQKSLFDGKHNVTVALKSGKSTAIVSLEPEQKAARMLILKGSVPVDQLEAALLLPINGVLTQEGDSSFEQSLPDIFQAFLFSRTTSYRFLTQIDLARMYLLSFSIPDREVERMSVAIPINESDMHILRRLFSDRSILRDDQTIAIVNATGVSGIGRKLEIALTNLGATVVSVATGRTTQKTTAIYYSDKKTYTVERVESLLQRDAEEGSTEAADILIIIGSGSLFSGLFATL